MKCLSEKRLAAASLGEDARAALHAETCERCSAELAAMVELRAFARRAPVRTASSDRRARIAALVMATADAAEPVHRSRWPVVVGALAAVAAVAALAVWTAQPPAEYAVAWPRMPVVSPEVAHVVEVAPPAPPTASPAVRGAPAIAHHVAPPPPSNETKPGPAAKPTTRVFAGSQQHAREGEVSRDQVTLEPHAIIATARVVEPTAFERGWTALREARYADAISEFDQVTDPAIGEDAAYWAAIASARGGTTVDARRRLTAFVANYPTSQWAGDARALLARLPP